MQSYTQQPEKRNDFAADRSASAVNRLAHRLSRQLGLPAEHIRAALIVNSAVKEH